MSVENLIGRKFGRLTVAVRGANKGRRTFWLCHCECGNDIEVWAASLKNGATKSCGCWYRDSRQTVSATHGHSKTLEYRSWQSAKNRVTNPNDSKWHLYGGAGITMCEEWKNSFVKFREDMGPRPKGTTLGRIDSKKGYTPDNCRWETIGEQNRNTTRNIWLEYNGKTETLTYWADVLGIRTGTMSKWIKKGRTIADIVNAISSL
jgi:hypothetical protein